MVQEDHTTLRKDTPVLLGPEFSNGIFAILLLEGQKEDNCFLIYSCSLSSNFSYCDLYLKLIISKVRI